MSRRRHRHRCFSPRDVSPRRSRTPPPLPPPSHTHRLHHLVIYLLLPSDLLPPLSFFLSFSLLLLFLRLLCQKLTFFSVYFFRNLRQQWRKNCWLFLKLWGGSSEPLATLLGAMCNRLPALLFFHGLRCEFSSFFFSPRPLNDVQARVSTLSRSLSVLNH